MSARPRIRSGCRAETALMVLGNGAVVSVIGLLGLRGDLAPLLADPAHVVPAVAGTVAAAVAWSWARYAQALRGDNLFSTNRIIRGMEWVANYLPAVGLAGTILGLIAAVTGHAVGPEMVGAAVHAMRSTVLGIAGMLLVGFSARMADVAYDKADEA